MKKWIFFVFSLLVWVGLAAQHTEEKQAEQKHEQHAHEGEHSKYKLALATGYTHIPSAFEDGKEEEDVFVPSIGLDFFYFINEKWSLGVVADLELAEYLVDFGRENLDRERAFILAILSGYELAPGWAVLTGAGMEFEKHKNLLVVRLGTEYEFHLGQGWNLGPSLFFDFKEEFSTWTLGVMVGKRF